MKRLLAIPVVLAMFVALCAFPGCASTPTNAQNAVYQAVADDYDTALDIAIAYDSLPACELPTAPVLCSNKSTVLAIKAAKDKASPLVKAAEQAVRDPNFDGNNVQKAIAIAQAAVAALTSITSTLKVH